MSSEQPSSPTDGPQLVTYPPSQPFFRVHRADHTPAFFDTGPHGRFNPPEALSTTFGTLYLATTAEGAAVETLGRTRILTPDDIDGRRLTTCTFPRPVATFDTAARANRFRYTAAGIDLAADAIDTSPGYAKPHQLAALVQADGLDGITYRARHDNAHELISVAIFGEPGPHDAAVVFVDIKTEPLPDWLVDHMVGDFGFEILPDVPLP